MLFLRYILYLFIVRMRFDKLKKQLELLILLSDGRNYTVEELCERMGLSRRNFYYLLDFIKHAGFIVFKSQGYYHIDRRSPFFTQLLQTIQFTDKDVKTIHSVLTMAGNDSEMVNQLRQKLESLCLQSHPFVAKWRVT